MNNDEFIDWPRPGGACPVDDKAIVEIIYYKIRRGRWPVQEQLRNTGAAGMFCWDYSNGSYSVHAYRLVDRAALGGGE